MKKKKTKKKKTKKPLNGVSNPQSQTMTVELPAMTSYEIMLSKKA